MSAGRWPPTPWLPCAATGDHHVHRRAARWSRDGDPDLLGPPDQAPVGGVEGCRGELLATVLATEPARCKKRLVGFWKPDHFGCHSAEQPRRLAESGSPGT